MDVNGKEIKFVVSPDELKGIELEPFFAELSAATYKEPHLLGQPAENLIAQFEAGLSAIGVCEGRLVAHTTIWELTEHDGEMWYELGTTWVHPEFRGKNVNKALYRMFLPLHSRKNILATTTNAASLSVGQDRTLHFEKVPRSVLPEVVWRESCCCSVSKMGAETQDGCVLAWREPQQRGETICWFRITQSTAKRLLQARGRLVLPTV